MRRAVTIALALAGCGPLGESSGAGSAGTGSDADGPADGSSDDGDEEDDAETGATHPTMCLPSPQDGPPLFDPEDCTTYEREEPSTEYPALELAVRIHNASDRARTLVPLGTLKPARYYEIVGSVGELEAIDPAARCPTHFADYHCDGSSLEDLCADLVLAHDSITLAPGASIRHTWTPWLVFEMSLPPCVGWVQSVVPCAIPRFVRPGAYEVVVRSAPTDACADCCVPAPGETCESDGQPTSGIEPTVVPWDGVCEMVEVVLR